MSKSSYYWFTNWHKVWFFSEKEQYLPLKWVSQKEHHCPYEYKQSTGYKKLKSRYLFVLLMLVISQKDSKWPINLVYLVVGILFQLVSQGSWQLLSVSVVQFAVRRVISSRWSWTNLNSLVRIQTKQQITKGLGLRAQRWWDRVQPRQFGIWRSMRKYQDAREGCLAWKSWHGELSANIWHFR